MDERTAREVALARRLPEPGDAPVYVDPEGFAALVRWIRWVDPAVGLPHLHPHGAALRAWMAGRGDELYWHHDFSSADMVTFLAGWLDRGTVDDGAWNAWWQADDRRTAVAWLALDLGELARVRPVRDDAVVVHVDALLAAARALAALKARAIALVGACAPFYLDGVEELIRAVPSRDARLLAASLRAHTADANVATLVDRLAADPALAAAFAGA